jgi:RNA recognition motif-containing protein
MSERIDNPKMETTSFKFPPQLYLKKLPTQVTE